MKIYRVLLAIQMALLLGGCSGFDLLNFVDTDSNYVLEKEVPYGEGARQKIDILVPKDPPNVAARPVVVFFYGGGWTAGSRKDYRFVGAALTKLGYIAVIPDYRLYPEVTFPAFENDAARALAWTQENIYRYGGDPAKIIVMGHSAGAHIAALLALDPSYGRSAGVATYTIKGVIGLAGPYAMVPSQVKSVREVFAGLPDENVARPVAFVTSAAPPMLLLYGLDDKTVGRGNATELADRLKAVGREVVLKEYPEVGHPGIILAMTPLFSRRAPVLADVKSFIDRTIGP